MNSSASYNFDGLNKFVKGISRKHIVKVGVLGGKNARKDKGPSNAEVGLAHELGSFSRGIPARSWLRMPLWSKSRDVLSATKAGGALKLLAAGKMREVFHLLGVACVAVIREAFVTRGFGKWKPLAQSTIEAKGHDLPLVVTRQLQRSVTSKVEDV